MSAAGKKRPLDLNAPDGTPTDPPATDSPAARRQKPVNSSASADGNDAPVEEPPTSAEQDAAEPWTQDLHSAMIAARSELEAAVELAGECSHAMKKLVMALTPPPMQHPPPILPGSVAAASIEAKRKSVDEARASCTAELSRVAALQGDEFPAVFERVKVALKLWSAIPNDPRLSGEWNMAPDRGVADELIAACGPPFTVVW